MPEQVDEHWIDDEQLRRRFWTKSKSELNLTETQVHDALGKPSVREFDGSPKEAWARLEGYAAALQAGGGNGKQPEARLVAWTDVYHRESGFKWSVTLRQFDGSVGTLLKEMHRAESSLVDQGYIPNGQRYKQPQTAAQEKSAPVMADGSADPSWCPIHQVTMKRREKDGQVWFSHKAGDGWCKGAE